MIKRLKTTPWLLLVFVLALALAACGPAQDPDDEAATMTAVAEGGPEQPEAEEPEEGTSEDEASADQATGDETAADQEASAAMATAVAELSADSVDFDLYGGLDPADFTTTESGLQYHIATSGDGEAAADGQIMRINFTGWLEDGTEFASTAARGEPGSFLVGMETGLAGFDEGMILFNAGDSGRLIIPPELAFGEEGAPPNFPPDTTLVFDLEVVEILPGPPEAPQDVPEDEFTTTDSGLKYHDFSEGSGEAVSDGQIVAVEYTSWLEDGTLFDSSILRGQPLTLNVGSGQVIPGWEEGMLGMKVGGQRQLVIPAELAYGEAGAGDTIPPNAILIYEIEMVDILPGPPEAPEEVDEADYTVTESGLKYYDLEVGDGPEVTAGSQASVHYTGWLEDGTMFDSSLNRGEPFTLVVGTGSVIQGWDEGLQGMQVGGRRQLVIPAELGYGETGSGTIPPGATLIFEVEVVDAQ